MPDKLKEDPVVEEPVVAEDPVVVDEPVAEEPVVVVLQPQLLLEGRDRREQHRLLRGQRVVGEHQQDHRTRQS